MFSCCGDNKFKYMNPRERSRLFNKAANDSRVIEGNYHFRTNKTDWLKEIFPQMATDEEWTEIEKDKIARHVEKILSDQSKELSEQEKEAFNDASDQAVSTANLLIEGFSGYIFSMGKIMFRSTLTHGLKVGWKGLKNAPSLEITPRLPRISVDGLALFGFFFLSDVFLGKVNDKVNQHRLEQIKEGEVGKTGFNQRDRTSREEISTLSSMTTQELPSFIDTLMSLHDAHKDIMGEMDYQKHLNKVDPYSPDFSHMDHYEAAVLILRRKYLEQLMAEKITGSVGQFHHHVQKKAQILDQQIASFLAS